MPALKKLLAEFVVHISVTIKIILKSIRTSIHTDRKHSECSTVLFHTLNNQENTECTQNLTTNLKLLAHLQKHHHGDNKHKPRNVLNTSLSNVSYVKTRR